MEGNYEIHDSDDMNEDTFTWTTRIERDTEHDLLELQKMQDMQDKMDDITETDMKAKEAPATPKNQHWDSTT
eukprot:5456252-Amphidinium_carterae.1